MSWQTKLWTLAVILLLGGTSALTITAFVSSHWGRIPSQSLHFGLSIICDENETCSSGTLIGADDVLNLLITVFVISSVLSMTCGIMELFRSYACFAFLGGVSLLLALLGFAAMVHSVVVFNALFGSLYTLSWAFAVGWLSVLTSAISAALSIYLWWTVPKTTSDESSSSSAPTVIATITGNTQSPPATTECIVPPPPYITQ
ncbi:uncharacterized protein ACNLHF_001474 [Anomaloglossus baeobatrachus]|uniref:uncharacterized protein LOC142256584 n=1 Tax=Anomaloglossus baeobatrachus TaxID=238106 RepID=UPI003F50046D